MVDKRWPWHEGPRQPLPEEADEEHDEHRLALPPPPPTEPPHCREQRPEEERVAIGVDARCQPVPVIRAAVPDRPPGKRPLPPDGGVVEIGPIGPVVVEHGLLQVEQIGEVIAMQEVRQIGEQVNRDRHCAEGDRHPQEVSPDPRLGHLDPVTPAPLVPTEATSPPENGDADEPRRVGGAPFGGNAQSQEHPAGEEGFGHAVGRRFQEPGEGEQGGGHEHRCEGVEGRDPRLDKVETIDQE